MRKGPESVYDMRNISVVICDTDIPLKINSEGWLRWKLYDKRDDFNFPIVNFTFICSNIPAAPGGTLGLVASLLEATLYQGNPDTNHMPGNIVSTEKYILHMQVLLECCYI
jgi:hypothetical protein